MTADRDRPPADDGWDALAQAWQQIVPPSLTHAPAELRRRVLRADLRFRLLAALEVLCYLAMIALLIVYMRERKGPAAFMWAFMMMTFVAWGLDFAIRIRQGLWQAADQSTAAWLALLAARCARKRRYARTTWLALVTMYLAVVAYALVLWLWLPRDFARLAANAWVLVGLLLVTLGFQYVWASCYLRGVAAEEREIAALRGEPGDAG